jgi:hypothetical protein
MNGNGFYGRYKGRVISNADPLRRGRLLVEVSDVLGRDPCIWAESASPLAGQGMGLYVVPEMNAGVWVEFEQGDPDHAIWTGSWRGSAAEIPPPAQAAPPGATPPIVLGTPGQNTIVLSDVPGPTGEVGGILIKCKSGAFIAVTDTGITIDNGKGAKIALQGPNVNIN